MPKAPPKHIAALIKRFKLTHHTDAIAAALRPAVSVTGKRAKTVRTGASKFGGEPDLPKSVPWPEMTGKLPYPYHFLAQLNLADLPHAHLRSGGKGSPVLPRTGHVYLWYNTLAERKLEERTTIDARLWQPSLSLLTHHAKKPLERRAWPDVDQKGFKHHDLGHPWRPFRRMSLTFKPIFSIDQSVFKQIMDTEESEDTENGWNRVYDFYRALHAIRADYGNHQILGDLFEMQSDLRFDAACEARKVAAYTNRSAAKRLIKREAAGLELLFKFESDERGPGWTWGDMGSLCWFISRKDLKTGKLGAAIGVYNQGG